MSINPQHVDSIFSGEKKYEFRRIRCKRAIDSILIYSTAPIMQIVGEVEVKEIIEDSPQKVWKRTASAAGIDKAFFDEYYSGKKNAIAYALGKVIQYSKPQLLSDYGIKSAPQSFMYIDSSKLLQQI
jgi:predicted transcriptional regulator